MKNDAKYPEGTKGTESSTSGDGGKTKNWTPYLIGGILGLLLVIFGMANCWFSHSWNAATCTAPKTCADCGKTEGSALGHNYTAATATSPKTCKICGRTEGTVVSHTHSWVEATCTAPKYCLSCGETIGTVTAHQWVDATCIVCGATAGSPGAPTTLPGDDGEFGNPRIGDTVIFGKYEQDNNPNNGKEDIEWIVIDKSGNSVLLMSRLALDCIPYNTYSDDVTWEDCSLRSWLNSTFYNSAFTSSEQNRILMTTVSADKNPDFPKVNPGSSTNDKVYLLSVDEALYYFPDYKDRVCTATKYTQSKGVVKCWWWLRTPGETQDTAVSINSNGSWDETGSDVAGAKGSVRPVLWVSSD